MNIKELDSAIGRENVDKLIDMLCCLPMYATNFDYICLMGMAYLMGYNEATKKGNIKLQEAVDKIKKVNDELDKKKQYNG